MDRAFVQLAPGGETGFMIFVSLLVFVLGFGLFFEIAFILMPLIGWSPTEQQYGVVPGPGRHEHGHQLPDRPLDSHCSTCEAWHPRSLISTK